MFDVNFEIEGIKDWIRDWFNQNGPKASAVIGISGGKDSTIVAKLLVDALGKDRVVGVIMPNGVQKDISDSHAVCDLLGIKSYIVNIGNTYQAILSDIQNKDSEPLDIPISEDTKINIAPRLRMTVLYAIAQSLPNGGRVCNTCNCSEDYVGYSTKYGDSAGDFSPCCEFTVTYMLQIGDALGLPAELVHKTPSDGLCGKTDEDNLGFTYAELDHYIETGEIDDPKKKENIERRHRLNLHKVSPMPKYERI